MVFATCFIINIAHRYKRPVNKLMAAFKGVFLCLFYKNTGLRSLFNIKPCIRFYIESIILVLLVMAGGSLPCSSDADAAHVVVTECFSLNPESSELEYLHLINGKLVWKNDLESLKKCVENALELQGKWLSPAGSTKQFKSSNGNVIINWYYKEQHTLN